MLTAVSVISQTVYPRKAVIDNDTVCIMNIEQVKTVNKVFIDRDECRELNDSLNSAVKVYDVLAGEQRKIITAQEERIVINQEIIAQKDVIIASDEKLMKQTYRKIFWLKVQKYVYGAAGIGVGIIAKSTLDKLNQH